MQLQQGQAGGKGSLPPRGWVEGHACCQAGEGASFSLPLFRVPLLLGTTGPGGTELFPGAAPVQEQELVPVALYMGHLQGEGAAAMCQQLLPRPQSQAEAIVQRNARPDPSLQLQGSFLSQEGCDGLPTCGGWWGGERGQGAGQESQDIVSCILVTAPWAQTSRPFSFVSRDVEN